MLEKKIKKSFVKKLQLRGSAMILTMFILAGMLIVAMSGSYLILIGITAAGMQSQSTKAYFAAEAGIEDILWEFRKNEADYASYIGSDLPLKETTIGENIGFKVYHTYSQETLHDYTSIGSCNKVKRSVEVSF
jgi:hypothetical protein